MKFLTNPILRLKFFLNLTLLIISLYGISQKDFTVDQVSFVDRMLINLFSPLQSGVYSIRNSVVTFFRHYVLIVNTSKENAQLKKHIDDLETTIFQMEELRRENERLKELMQFAKEIGNQKILAQVIGWDSSGQFKVLRINKGEAEGISLRSTVITGKGLVGHIYRLTGHYADVLTILDQNNRVDSIVDRTRSHGITEGYLHNILNMKYVTRTEPVSVGDKILTSGLGRIYPKGLFVGQISRIERESYGITQLIEVTPSVDFSKLEEVVVLLPLELPPTNDLEDLDAGGAKSGEGSGT